MMTMQSKQQGFTLLEIVLVVAILALSSMFVVLSLPDSKQEQAMKESEAFQLRFQYVQEQALINAQTYGLYLNESKGLYEFLLLTADGWQPIDSPHVKTTHELPNDWRMELHLGEEGWLGDSRLFDSSANLFENTIEDELEGEGKEQKIPPPQIWIMSTMEITPFRLIIENQDHKETIRGEENGVITRLSDDDE